MLVNGSNFTTIWIESDNQKVKIIDQRLLPHELKVVTLNTVNDVEFAIREMQVRGAPNRCCCCFWYVHCCIREPLIRASK